MSLPWEVAVKIAEKVVTNNPVLIKEIQFEKDAVTSIAESLANSKLFDWISADDITPDQYDNLIYQFTRGLDEDLLTPLRNPQTLVFAPDDNFPSSPALHELDVALIAGAIILPAIYLGAAYVRNRDIARLSIFTYAREQQQEFGKSIKTKFGKETKAKPSNSTPGSNETEFELRDIGDNDTKLDKKAKTTNRFSTILKELKKDEDYIPIPIFGFNGKLLDCLYFPKLKPTPKVEAKLSASSAPKQSEESEKAALLVNKDENKPTDTSSEKSKSDNGFLVWTKKNPLSKIAAILWTFVCQYSMFYWIGWGFVLFSTGLVLTTPGLGTALLFGLPLIPSIPYLGWKLRQAFSSTNDESQQAKEKSIFDTKIINQYYVVTKVAERYKKIFKLEADTEPEHINAARSTTLSYFRETDDDLINKSEAVEARKKQVTDYINQLKGDTFWEGKTIRIVRGSFFGFLSGFMGASFGLWAITDFLGIMLKVTIFTAAATPLTTALVLGGILAVAVGVGVYLAIYKGIEAAKEHQNLKDNIAKAETLLGERNKPEENNSDKVSSFAKFEEKAAEAKAIECRIAHLRNELMIQDIRDWENDNSTYRKQIADILKHAKPLDFPKFDGERYGMGWFSIHSDRFFRNYSTPGVWTWFKKRFWELTSFVDGSGTGSFIVRYLIKGGAISMGCATLFAINPPALVTIAIAAAVVAVVVGALKVYRYRANEQLRMDNKFVEEIQVRAKCLEEEVSALKAQEAYLVTRMAKYSDERRAAEEGRSVVIAAPSLAPRDQFSAASLHRSAPLPPPSATTATGKKRSVSFTLPNDNNTSAKVGSVACRNSFFYQDVVVSKDNNTKVISHDEQVEQVQSLTRAIAADLEKLFKSSTTTQRPSATSCTQEHHENRADNGGFAKLAIAVKAA